MRLSGPLVILGLALASWAEAPLPSAWSRSSWGMSPTDLKAAFEPGQVIDLKEATKYRVADREAFEAPMVGIPSIEIAGVDLKVSFLTEGGLHQVNLDPVTKTDSNETNLQRLELALTAKYGQPFASKDGQTRTSQWKTPTALILLQYTDLKQISFRSLWLVYLPLPKSDLL